MPACLKIVLVSSIIYLYRHVLIICTAVTFSLWHYYSHLEMSLMRCCWGFIENSSLDLFIFLLIIYVIWSELHWQELSI